MEAYCVKCKAKQEMESPESVVMKNGRNAMKDDANDCYRYTEKQHIINEIIKISESIQKIAMNLRVKAYN